MSLSNTTENATLKMHLQGTDSIAYTTLAGTFDQSGAWRLQAVVTLASGTWRGETALLHVYADFG